MRNLNYGIFRSIAILASLWMSPVFADQVVLKNGDRVTGAIVKKDATSITIKTVHFGVVTTAWDQVESVTADKPINILLQGEKKFLGTLTTAGGRLQVNSEDIGFSAGLDDVTTLRDSDEQRAYERLLRPGWGDLWAGTATIGFAGTAGNAKTLTFTTGINAARVTNTDKTSIYFNIIRASAVVNGTSAATARAVRGGIGYSRDVTPRLAANFFNDYEYDRFQNLDLRFVLGGGLGFHAVKTDFSRLDVLAGFDYNHSSFSTPLTRNSGEFFWGDEYNLKVSSLTSLVQSFRMFNNLSDTGTYRMNFDIGASTKLSTWLTWNVMLSDRYLNSPAPGRKTNDLLYTTGLGINFSR